jgi:hypothetical protein
VIPVKYSQKKTLQVLVDYCARNQISGIVITEQDGLFTLSRNGETVLESVDYDQCAGWLAGLADSLATVSGKIARSKGKEMAKKLNEKFQED